MSIPNIARITLAFIALATLVGCNTEPATCAPCNDVIVCTSTVAACIEDGGGTCRTGAPGDLELHADGTFHQEFGAYAQNGTWSQADNVIQLVSGGQVVGNVDVTEDAVCPAVSQ